MEDLSDSQLMRYARNILLNQVDVTGQQTLLSSHVAVVGAGGLGSPVLQYLAASGIGTLTIIDDDVVDETNLQRQVIHQQSMVGSAKVDSAKNAIAALNCEVKVIAQKARLEQANIAELLADADLVVIGTDNFSSRYLVNAYCKDQKLPLVTGAAIGTSGQLTSFDFAKQNSPCFECIYERSDDDMPSCATAGVLGPVVGTIGSMMALETLKILIGIGEPLYGRLMVWDALTMQWNTFTYQHSEQCTTCR